MSFDLFDSDLKIIIDELNEKDIYYTLYIEEWNSRTDEIIHKIYLIANNDRNKKLNNNG